jgi:hypothetical protein
VATAELVLLVSDVRLPVFVAGDGDAEEQAAMRRVGRRLLLRYSRKRALIAWVMSARWLDRRMYMPILAEPRAVLRSRADGCLQALHV